MRVSVEHRQDETLFGRKKESVTVIFNIEFTEEEKAIVKQRKLENDHITIPPENVRRTIGALVKVGFIMKQAINVVQAKELEADILQQLKYLKEHIADSADLGTKRVIEL